MSGSLTWNRTSSSSVDRPRGHPVHASQRSTSGQPGECRLLSSPQRHARRRRGELRAHWDAGDRLERGQERQGQGIWREGAARVWFECLLHRTRARSFGQQHDTCSGRARYLSSDGNEVSSRNRRSKKAWYAPHADGVRSGVLLAQGSHADLRRARHSAAGHPSKQVVRMQQRRTQVIEQQSILSEMIASRSEQRFALLTNGMRRSPCRPVGRNPWPANQQRAQGLTRLARHVVLSHGLR